VPISTLQRSKEEGGWDLINVEAKSKALFIRRMRTQGLGRSTITADWLARWKIRHEVPNPPYSGSIPASLTYLREYVNNAAYVQNQGSHESNSAYKKRIYKTLLTIDKTSRITPEMRITKIWPQVDWKHVWTNLHSTPVDDTDKIQWYRVMHDIIPTNVRLHRIRLASTEGCAAYGQRDSLEHRLIECGEATIMWNWTRSKIANIMRTSATNIPTEWLTRPHFRPWPQQRNRAVLWMLAKYVRYRLDTQRGQMLQDLMDFMRRAKWKIYKSSNRGKLVANFLTVLDESH
jgi:hypothetical protein